MARVVGWAGGCFCFEMMMVRRRCNVKHDSWCNFSTFMSIKEGLGSKSEMAHRSFLVTFSAGPQHGWWKTSWRTKLIVKWRDINSGVEILREFIHKVFKSRTLWRKTTGHGCDAAAAAAAQNYSFTMRKNVLILWPPSRRRHWKMTTRTTIRSFVCAEWAMRTW